ncbi:MAG: hypothetical protein ACJAYU_003261 [Bradymonadia bacterium]|jgi:hypothetical protein
MNLKRLLSALPWLDLPSQVARSLKRLEIHDSVDVALVEWALIGGFDQYELFSEWLENWPPPAGFDKTRCSAKDFERRLVRLVRVGAVVRATAQSSTALSGEELSPGEVIRDILGGYPTAISRDDETPALELGAVSAALRKTATSRHDGATRFLTGDDVSAFGLTRTDIDGLPPKASQIAESLIAACQSESVLQQSIQRAIHRLAADLPSAAPARDAARTIICGFSIEVAAWFDPTWLLIADGVENSPRRDHFARVWLHFAGIRYRVSGLEESAIVRGIKLIDGDPRREVHWREEAAMQNRLEEAAEQRIKWAVADREAQKKAFASGRRE